MEPLELVIDDALRSRFPIISCGALRVKGLDRFDATPLLLASETLRSRLESTGLSVEGILDDSRIAGWRRALQTSGLKASKYRSSVEQLVRRTLRGDAITTSSPLVRLYCQISAMHVAPLGAYDVISLPCRTIDLRFARPGDSFEPLGASTESMPLTAQVPVYAAGSTVLCWAFNVRDSASTALGPGSVEALFSTEAVFPEHEASARAVLDDLHSIFEAAGLLVTKPHWTGDEGRLTI